MNRYFKETFSSEWIKYVAVVILSILIMTAAFGLYHAPKEQEKIDLFFAGKVKDYSFEKSAKMSVEGIKKVEISSSDPKDNTFHHKYSVVGLNGADVVLVPLSIAEKTECKTAFYPLSEVEDPYLQEGQAYGAFLPDQAKEALSRYFLFGEERYVVFVVASSVNAGRLSDRAIDFAKWLVRYV